MNGPKRKAYLFDVDGTLADNGHRSHHIVFKDPPDWDAYFAACGDDKPIEHVIQLACHLGVAGVAIVYVTGRSTACRDATEAWLYRHKLPSGPVYMRKAGDHRPDNIIKIELLAEVRQDGYDIVLAFDDRNRVVQAWREAGVACAQVADGDF